jgi:hypothetical protein
LVINDFFMATLGVHHIPQTLKFAVIHLDITII